MSAGAILVVEDEKHLADGLRFNLKAEGFDVTIAPDGEQGLEALKKNGKFAAVILDIMLPGIDGFEVTRRLRAAGQFVPVLMLTARGSSEDVLHGFESGADDYLPRSRRRRRRSAARTSSASRGTRSTSPRSSS
jgi:DNA-binding response OmpR family regulator